MSANPKVNNKFLTGGVLNINIQMQGWDKLMQATQAVQTQFITQSFDPGLQQMNTTLTTKMKEKQHYWLGKRKRGTPHMRDVTRGIRSGVLQYSTIVPVKYAQAENRRPGGKVWYTSQIRRTCNQ